MGANWSQPLDLSDDPMMARSTREIVGAICVPIERLLQIIS
jgi:hypothetical protein